VQDAPNIPRRGPFWGRGYESDFNVILAVIIENGNPHDIAVI
jgi:hypothetical protein